jgi:hypothetical protein
VVTEAETEATGIDSKWLGKKSDAAPSGRRGEMMSDPREYSFRDWIALFLNAIPAFLLALVILLSPLLALGVLALALRFFGR